MAAADSPASPVRLGAAGPDDTTGGPLSGRHGAFVAGTLGAGGAEKQLFLALSTLVRLGARATVLSLAGPGHWGERLRAAGVAVVDCRFDASRLRRLRGMWRRLSADPPDWVQSQHFFANPYAGLLGRRLGVPSVGGLRNSGRHELVTYGVLHRFLSLGTVDWLVANSWHALDEVARRAPRRLRLRHLPNAVEATRPVERPPSPQVRLLAAGRLVPQKRFDRFVDLVAELARAPGAPIKAKLVGDGPLRAELTARARGRGLGEETLSLPGWVDDIGPCLAASDLLVVTSDEEGVPNVVMEAMAAALPVVATDVGGVCEVVRHDVDGLLVERRDFAALLDATRRLIGDAALRRRLGDRARTSVAERYSLDRLERGLVHLYAEVLS